MTKKPYKIDISGQRFGNLTILKYDREENGRKFWHCICDCGNYVSYRSDALKLGRRVSCGCRKSTSDYSEYKKRLEKRLNSRSKWFGECLEWQKRFDHNGYGLIKIRRKPNDFINTHAHRAAYEVWVGDIPEGLFVLHKCDNPKCINPDHLWLGTHKDNMKDMMDKKRQFRPQGELHGMSVLNYADVRGMRKLYDDEKWSLTKISKQYHVSPACVYAIVKRKSWKHVE